MKYLFILLLVFPFKVYSQKTNNSLSHFLSKDWVIMKAINVTDRNEVLYDRINNIKNWNLEKAFMFKMNEKQLGIAADGVNVDIGVADSISDKRFIVNVTYPNGFKCVYEYADIVFAKNKLTYTFKRWTIIADTKKRLFHYGFYATCEPSKAPLPKPTLAELEKKRGNKISYVFTTDDAKPIANKQVKIIIPTGGVNMITDVYTDSAGKATGYYPDSYFASNNHITLFIEYGNLKSSAVLEKKYCPAVLKRVLTAKKDDDVKIGIIDN